MSLEAILDHIQAAGEAQAAEVLQKAESEARSILAQAHQEADAIYQAAYQGAALQAEGECARLRNQALFEANCLLGKAREDFIAATIEKLRLRLEHLRGSDAYVQAMRCFLLEILSEDNGLYPLAERLQLQADPRDRDLLEALLREQQVEVKVDYSLQGWGGLKAFTEDRKVRIVNTLEARLDQATPYLRRELAQRYEQQTNQADARAVLRDELHE